MLNKEQRIIEPCLEIMEATLCHQGKKAEPDRLAKERAYLEQNNMFAISRLVVILSTKCTLKCKHCCNLMPLYDKPYNISCRQIIEQIDTVLSCVDKCYSVNLIGGEPLLYPQLGEILKYTIDNYKIVKIEITTNGTLIPDDSLIPYMRNEKVFLKISDYGNLIKTASLVNWLEKNKINFVFFSDFLWIDVGGVSARNKSEELLKKEFQQCSSGKHCKTILNGKLYHCARAAHLHDLGFWHGNNVDYLDLGDTAGLREKLFEFYLQEYCTACDYCDYATDSPKFIMPGQQLEMNTYQSDYTIINRNELQNVRSWLKELSEAKDWLEGQYKNYIAENERKDCEIKELHNWAHQLEDAKSWLAQQYENYKSESDRKDKIIEELIRKALEGEEKK